MVSEDSTTVSKMTVDSEEFSGGGVGTISEPADFAGSSTVDKVSIDVWEM